MPADIIECSLVSRKLGHTDVCSDSQIVESIAQTLAITVKGDIAVMKEAKRKTQCDTEKCVVSKFHEHNFQAMAMFKIDGPRDTSLLSNINIDRTLQQWVHLFKNFLPYNFNMLDYYDHSIRDGYVTNHPDTLATRDMALDVYAKGYRTMACVINSDVYSGAGKHWMTLFVDMRQSPATVEFFNSSGNSPGASWRNWMDKTKTQLEVSANLSVKLVTDLNRHQQHSRSECGVYSLYYIWHRLNGYSPDYFKYNDVPDSVMLAFRQHLFAGEDAGLVGDKFDLKTYLDNVEVKWE